MNVFILIMTVQFNQPHIKPQDSVFDVYHSAYKTKETCWADAYILENLYKYTRPTADIMFMCVGQGEKL